MQDFSTEIKDTAPENSTSNKSAALIEVLISSSRGTEELMD